MLQGQLLGGLPHNRKSGSGSARTLASLILFTEYNDEMLAMYSLSLVGEELSGLTKL